MEQDIKILKEKIKNIKKYDTYRYDWTETDVQTVEHLIKAYKELEEERQIVGMPVRNKRDGRIGIVLHQWKSGSVAVLESINPRVINTHDSWNTLEIVTDEVKQTQTKCETIPVSLVEEKLEKEKLPNIIVGGRRNAKTLEYGKKLGRIEMCEELLEKRK